MHMSERWPSIRHLLLAALLLCIVGRFLAVGLEEVRSNVNSSGLDQRSYLNLGLKIRAGKNLTDGNRHPLYPALLAPFAHREWAYFTGGKLLSLTLGALSLLLIFWTVKRLHGAEVALSIVLLLSINPIFQRVTSHVMAESLLVGLFFATWYLTVQGFRKQRFWIGAGAVAALAYVTKGTGQLLLVAFIPAVILRYRRGIRQVWRGMVSYIVAYGLVALPLWAYNLDKYGNLLYNRSTTHAMWFDTWEDRYVQGRLPTLVSYFRSHSLSHALARWWQGLGRVIPVWIEALVAGDSWLCLLGLAMLLLATALVQRRGTAWQLRDRRAELMYSSLLVAIYYALFAWYAQVVTAPRFFLPLAPVIYLCAVDALAYLWRTTARWLRRMGLPGLPLARGLYLLVCVSLILGLTMEKADAFRTAARDPFAQDREYNAEADALFAWLRANLSPKTNFLWGPSTTLGSWRHEEGYDFEEIPSDADSWADLAAYARDEKCTYAIIDIHTVHRRLKLLSPYFAVEQGRIRIQAIPPNWALTYVQSSLPCRWCVFQLLDQMPISQPLSLTFGEQIQFLGYDVADRRVQPGGHLLFTLYWQPLAPISENYTVFTHLLGPGNVLLAQLDRQPLQRRVSTEHWFPGAIYADRFEMPLPVDILPGESQLEVGLYQLTTMERLPVVAADGQQLPEDRVLLPITIVIEPVRGDGKAVEP
jgi:hypothetical protein